MGWIPGSGRTPGEGHDNPLQYPCLENSMQREASELQSMGSQSQTQLRRLSTHTRLYLFKSPIVCLCLFCALCEWHIAFCHLPLPSQHNVYYLSTICIAVVHFSAIITLHCVDMHKLLIYFPVGGHLGCC